MKSGFFLSGTAHSLLISFLVANGVFFMPERQYENLEKLDIMVLSEAEFDAMASLPPSIENLTINEYQEPKNLSLNLGLKSSLSEIQEIVNKHNLNRLNPINLKKDLIKELEPPIDFIPETPPILEKEINKKEQLDLKINKLGNEINSLDTPTLNKPKPREADRVDRIASDNKNSQKISDDLVALNKELISTDNMVNKIKECISARKDENFKIIARSDAKSVEGIDKMIDRCKAYIDAGAEIIFPEALHDEKDFEKVRKELKCYLLANMTEFGKTKLFNYKELEQFGYNIVIYPVTTQRLAMKNVEDGLRDIYANGHQNNIIDKMQTRKRLYELVDYEKYNSLDEKIYNFSTEGHE